MNKAQGSFDSPRQENKSLAAGIQIWSWQTSNGKYATYNVGCLTDTFLYVRQRFSRYKFAEAMLEKLQSGMPPADVFKETADAIPLSDISEFRCGRKANVLEISQRNKKPVFSLDTERDPVVRSIYESLRAKLAPNEQPAEGCLGTGSSTANPVVGLFFSVIVGVVLIWIAASTDEADLERIAGKGLVDALLDRPLAVLGLTGAVVITLVCLTVSTVWLIYRIKHALPAFVVTIAATAKPEH